jgi:hypothetical protein
VKLSLPKFQLALVLVLAAVSAAMVALIYSTLTPSFYFELSLRLSSFPLIFYQDAGQQDSNSNSAAPTTRALAGMPSLFRNA